MPRTYPAEFRARAIALVWAGRGSSRPPLASASIRSCRRSGCARTTSTTAGALAGSRRSPQSCMQSGDESASWNPSSKSSARSPSSSARTSRSQKALPGDRPSRRCRGTGRPMLPDPRGRPAEPLQAQAHPDHAAAAATGVADRADPGGPHRLTRHLRLPSRPRRALPGHGHPGVLEDRVGADGTGRATDCPDRCGSSACEVSSPPTTWSTGNSIGCVPTSCGSPASRNTAPEKGGCTARRSWTRSAAGSWAGRSTPDRTPPSWSTRQTWPSATGPEPGGSSMQIELLTANGGISASSWQTRSSSTSRSATTDSGATQHWATAPRSSTNYAANKTPFPPPVGHRRWKPDCGAGQDVTRSSSRPKTSLID